MVTALRDAVGAAAARGFNYDLVEGKPTGARIVALAQTLSMMAARRMIWGAALAGREERRDSAELRLRPSRREFVAGDIAPARDISSPGVWSDLDGEGGTAAPVL